MARWLLAAAVLVLGTGLVQGQEKKAGAARKPVGTWTRTVNDLQLKFDIKPDKLVFTLSQGTDRLQAEADYGVTQDGIMFGRLSKVERQGNVGGPEEGELFSFKFELKNGTLTISDLQASSGAGDARQVVEGEYRRAGKE